MSGINTERRGEISGDEDLQIDGKVKGPISLPGHRLTIGRTAQLSSEVTAREVIVYGTAAGNIRARDRIEIKKDAEVVGDITTARISVEDGASFKGRIEIERTKTTKPADPEAAGSPVSALQTNPPKTSAPSALTVFGSRRQEASRGLSDA